MKKLLLLAALLLPGWLCLAQSDTTYSLQREYELRCSQLSAADISTGVLIDKTLTFSNLHRFDGVFDTVASRGLAEQVYMEYYNASLNRAGLKTPEQVEQSLRGIATGMPLLLVHFQYNKLLPDAEALGLVYTDTLTGQVHDVLGRTQSPYTGHRAFAIGMAQATYYSHTVPFYLGTELVYGNEALAGAILEADFGDGLGYRQLTAGTTETVTYTANGDKTIKMRWTKNANSWVAATTIRVMNLVPPDLAIGIIADRYTPGQNEYGAGKAYIKFSTGNTSGKLCRPFIFVEGIDFNVTGITADSLNHYQPYGVGPVIIYPYQYGEAGWPLMVAYNPEYPSLEKLPAFRQNLQNDGYDMLYVDFRDGSARIEQNAMMLVKLLEWVNNPANRNPGCDNENTIVGASMGGQVVRYALSYMENNNLCHNTKLYVSFDSPHMGANASVGIQHLVDVFTNISNGATQNRRKMFKPAAMQMLNLHFDQSSMVYIHRTQWQQWQRQLNSWPVHLRKVAVANGSSTAQGQGYNAGDLILRSSFGFDRHRTNVFAVPGSHHLNTNNVVFYKSASVIGWPNIIRTVPSFTPHYDNAPGGRRQSARTIWGELPIAFDHGSIKNECFMPTISALAAHAAWTHNGSNYVPNFGYNIANNIPDRHLPDPSKYRFDAYFAPTVNEPHVQLTDGSGQYMSNNTEWMRNELRMSEHNLPRVLTGTYNFGSPYRRQLRTITVESGGRLLVNRHFEDGNPNVVIPVSGGTGQEQTQAGTFRMYTSLCDAWVQVNQGGLFELGDAANNAYRAEVTFGKGSVLSVGKGDVKLHPYSKIIMEAGSNLYLNGTLTLEPGAELIVRQGATFHLYGDGHIVLNGQLPNSTGYQPSVLTFEGNLHIQHDATFTFTHTTPNHHGYVRFARYNTSGTGTLDIEPGGRFHLMCNGPEHTIAVLADERYLRPDIWTNDIDFFFEDGKIEMGRDAFIDFANSNMRLANVHVAGDPDSDIDASKRYRSVYLWGCGSHQIYNTRFSHGHRGLTAFLNGCQGDLLSLDNVTFDRCLNGLHTVGGGVLITNSMFHGTSPTWGHQGVQANSYGIGWLMDAATLTGNLLKDTHISGYNHGIDFRTSIGTNLLLEGPEIIANNVGVVFGGPATLRGVCGSISSNRFGMRLIDNAILDLSNNAQLTMVNNGTYKTNDASAPQSPLLNTESYTIQIAGARKLLLDGGHNDLVGLHHYTSGIRGVLANTVYVNRDAHAHGNRWHVQGGPPINRDQWVNLLDTEVRQPSPAGGLEWVNFLDYNPAGAPLCDVVPCTVPFSLFMNFPCPRVAGLMSCPDCEVISTSYAPADSLHWAILRALSMSTEFNQQGNNQLALDMLHEVLMYPLQDTTAQEAEILALGYEHFQVLYALTLEDPTVPPTNIYNAYNQLLEAMLQHNFADSSYHNIPYTYMEQVLAAYSAGRGDDYTQALDEAKGHTHPLVEPYISYWECFLNAHQQMQDSLIDRYVFFDWVMNCSGNSGQGARYAASPEVEEYLSRLPGKKRAKKKQAQLMQLSPNPATQEAVVSVKGAPAGNAAIEVLNDKGQLIQQHSVMLQGEPVYNLPIKLNNLQNGLYLVRLITKSGTSTQKLSVVN